MGLNNQSNREINPRERKKLIDSEIEKEKETLFSIILQEAKNLNNGDLTYIFENLLCHSLEDGISLMCKLKLSKKVRLDSVKTVKFSIKHPEFTRRLRHLIMIDDKLKDNISAKYYLSETKNILSNEKNQYFSETTGRNARFDFNKRFLSESDSTEISDIAKSIVDKMNSVYSKHMELFDNEHIRHPKKISIDDRIPGEKAGEDTLFPMILKIRKFYPKNFIETIYDSLLESNKNFDYIEKQKYIYGILKTEDKNKLEKGFISFDDAQKIIQYFVEKKLIDKDVVEHILQKLKYYEPLDVVLRAKVRSIEDVNINELRKLLETYYGKEWEQNISLEKNYDTGLYEIKKTNDIIDEREEIEISKKYDHIRHGNIVDGNIYSEATIYDKNTGIEHRILKNGKEILNEYDDLGTCGYINGKIYHTGKKDNKLMLFENGVRILDQYDEIKFYEIIDKNIYCVVSKNGKYILLKNNEEISAEYDEIKFCDLVEPEYTYSEKERNTRMNIGKRFIGKKNNKWVLLKGEKEVSDEYDKIIYNMTKDGHVYYIASIGRKKCYLKDGEKISGEYDDIIYGGIENGKEYFKAKINNQWFVVKNGVETPVKYNINLYAGKTFFYYIVGGKDYLLVIDDGRYFVEENGEIVSKVYDDYQNYFTSISNGKLYWCIEKYHDYVLLENGKELLSGYSHIDFCESVGGHTYCAAKKDNKRVLFKDWNEVLTGYDEIRFREKVDGNIYYFAKKDSKIYLVKNGEIFTQGYDEFKYSRQGTRLDGKLYSIVRNGKKRLLLEDEIEISDQYNNISESGKLDGKIYHTAEKSNGTCVLLENGKEILEGYDNIWVREKADGNIYCIGKRGKNAVILENRKEISKEYDNIHYYGLLNGNLYYAAENNNKDELIENKIKDSNELKLHDHIKSKLDFLNLCMSCNSISRENLFEIQGKIKEYLRKKYSKEKQYEYSINSILSRYAKNLSYLFNHMMERQPEELIKTINPLENQQDDEENAKWFFEIVFKRQENSNKNSSEGGIIEGMPNGFGDISNTDTGNRLAEALGENNTVNEISAISTDNFEMINKEDTDKYSILGDVSIGTYNHINSLLDVYQYSGFEFDQEPKENIDSYLSRESQKLEGELIELNKNIGVEPRIMLFDRIENIVSNPKFGDKKQGCAELGRMINTIKDNLNNEEYDKLKILIDYFSKESN